MSEAWWINPKTGAVVPVDRHEVTLLKAADDKGLSDKLGLSNEAVTKLKRFREDGKLNDEDARMIGIEDGLVRVRVRNRGATSIEFAAKSAMAERAIIKKVREIAERHNLATIYDNTVNITNLETMERIFSGWMRDAGIKVGAVRQEIINGDELRVLKAYLASLLVSDPVRE